MVAAAVGGGSCSGCQELVFKLEVVSESWSLRLLLLAILEAEWLLRAAAGETAALLATAVAVRRLLRPRLQRQTAGPKKLDKGGGGGGGDMPLWWRC